ncbi:MAG: universal stress protein [Bacteroidota bacterium]
MNTKNFTSKYRLLVLLDTSKTSYTVLENAVQLAKAVNAQLTAFHAKLPLDVTRFDNQLTAVGEINQDYKTTNRLEQLVKAIAKREQLDIQFKSVTGKVKKAIAKEIALEKPDLVVMGKRKQKLMGLWGDGIIKFVMGQPDVHLLIAGADHKFHTYEELSLGIFGEALTHDGIALVNDLHQKSNNPLNFFHIGSEDENTRPSAPVKSVSYVFSGGANALDGFAKYVVKTNTQLLCISAHNMSRPLKQVVQKLDIPILITS